MRSSKPRSRGKGNRNNNNRSVGNIMNRVFDSSGPEGKVRGTPQQIIEKYQTLHRDAQLSNDRVAAENFQQHAEHYARMLGEAQRELEARREAQEAQQRERQKEREEREQNRNDQSDAPRGDTQPLQENPESQGNLADNEGVQRTIQSMDDGAQADVIDLNEGRDSGLVETVESAPKAKPARKPRTRKPKPNPAAETSGDASSDATTDDGGKSAAE